MQFVPICKPNLQHDIHHNYQLKVNKGILKRGVIDRTAKKVLIEDKEYVKSLSAFHPQMPYHATLSADACYWDRCWSSLWIYAFLLYQLQSKSSALMKNLRAVFRPPFFLSSTRMEMSLSQQNKTTLACKSCTSIGITNT